MQAIADGKSGLRTDVDAAPVPITGEACVGWVEPLPELYGASPGFATRQHQLAWASLHELLPTISAARAHWGPTRVGLLLGTSTGGLLASERAFATHVEGGALPPDYSCRDGHAFDAAPRWLAQHLDLRGPCYVVSAACASSGKALAAAKRWLENDVCDAVVVGGVDSLCRLTVMGFASLGVLARVPARPFSAEPPGMNVAEGAAWLILDRRRSDLALLGSGESSDAHHMVTPHPTGEGARLAMLRALANGGIEPRDVQLVNAHGTGTLHNDRAEQLAIDEVFGRVQRTSTKGVHGHTLGAAGALEAVVCAHWLKKGASYRDEHGAAQSSEARVSLSNSLAFGGSNVSLVLGSEPHTGVSPRALPEATVTGLRLWTDEPATGAWLQPGETEQRGALPAANWLPLRQRGRAGPLTRQFAGVLEALLQKDQAAALPIVYASAFGPVRATLDLLAQQQRGECSPLRFQQSVHNAAAGTLSIALGSHQATTSVAAGEDTFWAGLLEAMCWLQQSPQVALVVGEEAPPVPLLDEDYAPLASAWLLCRDTTTGLARIEVAWGEAAAARPALQTGVPRIDRNPCAPAFGLARAIRQQRWGEFQSRWANGGALSLKLTAAK